MTQPLTFPLVECPECKGKKEYSNGVMYVDCEFCNGYGWLIKEEELICWCGKSNTHTCLKLVSKFTTKKLPKVGDTIIPFGVDSDGLPHKVKKVEIKIIHNPCPWNETGKFKEGDKIAVIEIG